MKNKILITLVGTALLVSAASSFGANNSQSYHLSCQGSHDNSNGDVVKCVFINVSKPSWHWTTLEVYDDQGGKFQCGSGSGDSEINGTWSMSMPANGLINFTCNAPTQ